MSKTPGNDPGTCENCGKAPASVHIRRVSAGEEVELHLCPGCARERGVDVVEAGSAPPATNPVALLFQNMQETEGGTGSCHRCGLTFSTFRETGRLGCAGCYQAFAQELEPILRRVHGATRHTGKVPVREGESYDFTARIRRLNDDLERAIGAEDYERAAEIRDLIQDLEGQGSGSGAGRREQ